MLCETGIQEFGPSNKLTGKSVWRKELHAVVRANSRSITFTNASNLLPPLPFINSSNQVSFKYFGDAYN